MAYPFRKMTTRELKKWLRDNRYRERGQKANSESSLTYKRKKNHRRKYAKINYP
jgi:ribosomal protein L29